MNMRDKPRTSLEQKANAKRVKPIEEQVCDEFEALRAFPESNTVITNFNRDRFDKTKPESGNQRTKYQEAMIAELSEESIRRVDDKEPSDRWVLDSGATVHCTRRLDLYEFVDLTFKSQLSVASNKTVPIEGTGIVSFTLQGTRVRLGEVVYVPKMTENLMSLDLLLDNEFSFTCDNEANYRIYKKGNLVAKGRREKRTSFLHWVKHPNALFTGPKSQEMDESICLAIPDTDSIDQVQKMVHRRFGHPGIKRFNAMVEALGKPELKIKQTNSIIF